VLFRSSPPPPGRTGTAVEITRARAGWRYVHFAVRHFVAGRAWKGTTGSDECCLVLLRGQCHVEYGDATAVLGPRRDVFTDYPHAIYLPPRTTFRITASQPTELADARAPARKRFAPRVIAPEDCGLEIRGGGNATRQIVDIMAPGFPADRLLVCEVFTPSGNWSSYPPHKHDTDRPPAEVKLEEIYYYRFQHADLSRRSSDGAQPDLSRRSSGGAKAEAYGFQRLYDKRSDRTLTVTDGDVMLIRHGYHPFVTAYGYNAYYLNVLAGTRRSMAASDDPRYAAFRAWPPPDTRVPLVAPPRKEERSRGSSGPRSGGTHVTHHP
jgi:5-deoxy-glucuronate isomerase